MASVFGADVPAEAGPSFVADLMYLLSDRIPANAVRTRILFEQPWMSFRCRDALAKRGIGATPFEDEWPALRRHGQLVAAMNATDLIVIMLPKATIDDFVNGHRHSIVEQAVIAVGLKRTVLCNDYTALGTFISRRVEESP